MTNRFSWKLFFILASAASFVECIIPGNFINSQYMIISLFTWILPILAVAFKGMRKAKVAGACAVASLLFLLLNVAGASALSIGMLLTVVQHVLLLVTMFLPKHKKTPLPMTAFLIGMIQFAVYVAQMFGSYSFLGSSGIEIMLTMVLNIMSCLVIPTGLMFIRDCEASEGKRKNKRTKAAKTAARNTVYRVIFIVFLLGASVVSLVVTNGSTLLSTFLTIAILLVGSILLGLILNIGKSKKDFYLECVKNGIEELDTPAKIQKAELIAKRVFIKKQRDIKELFELSKELYLEKMESEKRDQRDDAIAELVNAENEQFEKLTKYASFEGREKRVAILSDELRAAVAVLKELEGLEKSIMRGSQKKEINSSVMGGIADGLAGPGAGVAAYIDAERKNEQIRAENKVNREMAHQATSILRGDAKQALARVSVLRNAVGNAQLKLLADTPKEKVFAKLHISTESITISETGAFTVKATVNGVKDLTILGDVPAVIDGTLSADLYQQDQLVGTALLVLPTYGIGNTATVEGICLTGAKKDVPYRVEYRPHLLWEMEK